MEHRPVRTCIGCRGEFRKDEVVRVVAGPASVLIDYREKLPGRGAYVCPNRECLGKALAKEKLARALRARVRIPVQDDLAAMLASVVRERIRSLVSMASKAGKLAAGFSAVNDALKKGLIEAIVYAEDMSDGTKGKLLHAGADRITRQATLFMRDELGELFNREFVGVVGIADRQFADAVWKEVERLKNLINSGQ